MSNQSGHKKTYTTEISALATAGFAIYQGYQHGVIRPELIGQLVMHSFDLAYIVVPAAICVGRVTWKKWFRKDEPRSSDIAKDRMNTKEGMGK